MSRPRWARLAGSVRVRTTLAATLIVAVALSVGSAILVNRFRQSLDNNRRNAAVARAADIASLASSGRLPSVLGLSNQDASFAQVIDQKGTVIAASADIAGEGALGRPATAPGGAVVTKFAQSPVEGSERSMLVSLPAGTAAQPLTVFTGYSLVSSDFAVRDVKLGLLIGLPILLVVVGGTAWLIVGRALRPIDAIRAEASQITTMDLHRRLPEPASRDEVARLARTMNSMLDRLEQSMEREKAFTADASHELRSPLASLRAQLEIGLAGGDATDWSATATDALVEEARIEHLVRDLLLLARLDRHNRGPSKPDALLEAIPVIDLADIVAADLAARPNRPGITLTGHIDERVPVAMVPELARRLVANLVDNAQRHAASQVTITVGRAGVSAELVVRDDGPGVAAADRERIFERFTRLDVARSSDDGGAGLGLAIVKDIVDRHGGRVGFTDSPEGARVLVQLPVADPVEPDEPPGSGRSGAAGYEPPLRAGA